MYRRNGFTLVEMLMVIAIIAILAALLFPTLSAAKARAQRTVCLSNLRQINLGLRMYSDESSDKAPQNSGITNAPILNWVGYKNQMKHYVGLKGNSSANDSLFGCPVDKFYYDVTGNFGFVSKGLHESSISDFSSYAFNGGYYRFQHSGSCGKIDHLNQKSGEDRSGCRVFSLCSVVLAPTSEDRRWPTSNVR